MKHFLPFLACLALCAMVFAIGYGIAHPAPDAGFIVGKDYEPARDWTTMDSYKVGKVSHWRSVHHHRDQRWTVTIQDGDREAVVGVPQSRWEQCRSGLWYITETQALLPDRPLPQLEKANAK